jgi:hypothetical protein
MKEIKIIFADGDFCYTRINATEEEIKKYYIGKAFPFAENGKEITKKCVKIEIL